MVIPAAWYMLRFFQGVMEGPPPDDLKITGTGSGVQSPQIPSQRSKALRDLGGVEFLVLLPLLALMIVLGVIPGAVTSRIQTSVEGIAAPLSRSPTTAMSVDHWRAAGLAVRSIGDDTHYIYHGDDLTITTREPSRG